MSGRVNMWPTATCLLVFFVSASCAADLPVLPNDNFIGYSYDALTGNPRSHLSDPGFKLPTIELTYARQKTSNDGKYLVPDSVSVKPNTNCDFDTTINEINGSKSYQDALSEDADVGFSTGMLKAFDIRFSAGVNFREIDEQTSNYNRRYISSVSTCVTYEVNSNHRYALYNVTPEFYRAVRTLTVGDGKIDLQPYLDFLEAYGTHFATALMMGSKIVTLNEFNFETWEKMHNSSLDVAVAAQASFVVALNISSVTDRQKQLAEQFDRLRSSVKTSYFGSKPPADGKLSTWVSQSGDSPYPITYKLSPITDLLADTYFPDDLPETMHARRNRLNLAVSEHCSHLKGCGVPRGDKIPLNLKSVRMEYVGTKRVTCPPEFSLLSCGNDLATHDDGTEDFPRYVIPVGPTTCECHSTSEAGAACISWCSNIKPQNFDIISRVIPDSLEVTVNCSGHRKVLGCHLLATDQGVHVNRQWYPTDAGRGCTCRDAAGASCVATCAFHVENHEVRSKSGRGHTTTVECSPGNYVLGCGINVEADYPLVSSRLMSYASSPTSCTCFDLGGHTCYAVCGVVN